MKNKKSITIACSFILGAINTFTANASENKTCSYIELLSDERSEIRINQIDGKLLFSGVKSYNNWKKSSLIEVSPGMIELSGAVIPKKITKRKYKKPSPNQIAAIAPLYFSVNILEGMKYQLSLIRKDNKVIDVKLASTPIENCSEKEALASSKYRLKPRKELVLLSDKQSALFAKLTRQIISSDNLNTVKSSMPAGFNSNLGNENDIQSYVPRYLYKINKSVVSDEKEEDLIRYFPLKSRKNDELDLLVANLAKYYRATLPGVNQIEFNLSQASSITANFIIDLQSPDSFTAAKKKSDLVYKKINRILRRNPPTWWTNDYGNEVERRIYPGGYAEKLASTTTNQNR